MDVMAMGLSLRADQAATQAREQIDPSSKASQASQAFEALFVQEILKIMRKSTPNSQKDFGGRMFTEMFDEQIAKHIAEAGLGMQDILRDALDKKSAQEGRTNVDRPDYTPFE